MDNTVFIIIIIHISGHISDHGEWYVCVTTELKFNQNWEESYSQKGNNRRNVRSII